MMQKTALWVVFGGFCFVFLAVPVAGLDILIDAVGYLVVFNALRFLGKLYPGRCFKVSAVLSLVLVAVCAPQLFIKEGSLVLWLAAARAGLEIGLYLSWIPLLHALLGRTGQKRWRAASVAMPGVAAAATALAAAGQFAGGALQAASAWVLFACQVLLLAGLLLLSLRRWPLA